MSNTDIKIRLESLITLDLVKKPNDPIPKLDECIINLIEPLGMKGYRNKDKTLTKDGVKALTQVLVQGLNANIQGAHQKGNWDSAEHLRYVISELERSFVAVVDVIEENDNRKTSH